MVVPSLRDRNWQRPNKHWGGRKAEEEGLSKPGILLNRACHLREHYTRVGANHAHYANYKSQYHCQHDGVLSYILTFRVAAELNQQQAKIQAHSVFYYALVSKQNE